MDNKFICPVCKEEKTYDINTVFTTLINTGGIFEFCSEDCLYKRLNEIKIGKSDEVFEKFFGIMKSNFILKVIKENPLEIEVLLTDYAISGETGLSDNNILPYGDIS